MALAGKYYVEFDIKSPPEKFFDAYLKMMNLTRYDDVSPCIDDDEKLESKPMMKEISFTSPSCHISEWYKSIMKLKPDKFLWPTPDWFNKIEATITIIHDRDNGCTKAIWILEYEAIYDFDDESKVIADSCVQYFKDMDANLLKSI